MLLFGVNQKGTIVNDLREGLETNGRIDNPRDLKKARDLASKSISKIQDKSKRNADKCRKYAHQYQVGD